MLSSGLLNDEQKSKAIAVLIRGIESQKTLVEDLLDVSRIVSGKMSIAHEKISLVSVVSDTIEQLRPIAAENQISLRTELDPVADDALGDSARLQQILNNLVNNAIKYTPPGGEIFIGLKLCGSGDAEITVSDTGVGISQENLTRIFERFEQGDNSSRRSFGGLGLGLTIARHLAELHEGSLRVESEGEGKGAAFIVDLPLLRRINTTLRKPNSNAQQSNSNEMLLEQTKLLIAEDDVDSLEMLRLVLETRCCR